MTKKGIMSTVNKHRMDSRDTKITYLCLSLEKSVCKLNSGMGDKPEYKLQNFNKDCMTAYKDVGNGKERCSYFSLEGGGKGSILG
jgi:hypothetical protein